MDPTYSEDEAEAILKRAVSAKGDRVSRDRLVQMAHELGVSESELRSAEAQVRAERYQTEELKAFQTHRRQDLINHVGIYVAINGAMLAMDFFQNGRIDWAQWCFLGWGIGVAAHIAGYFFPSNKDTQQEFEKWKEEQVKALSPDVRRALHELALEEVPAIEAADRLRARLGLSAVEAKQAVDAYNAENGSVFSNMRS